MVLGGWGPFRGAGPQSYDRLSTKQRLRGVVPSDLIDEANEAVCPSCGSKGLAGFYEARGLPSQTCVLVDTEVEANSYPQGEMLLGFCEECGMVSNTRFSAHLVDYSLPTEESQAFSPRFNDFADWLADELFRRYSLQGRTVLEIGCGKGDFLRLLAERGIAGGVGIDPGFVASRVGKSQPNLEFRRAHYGERDSELTADLVLSRHLMEHVPNTHEFLGWIAQSARLTKNSAVFTEVPDVKRVLETAAFWDVYYEHCSYFTMGSLVRALQAVSIQPDWLTYGFEGQYLLVGGSISEQRGESPRVDTPDDISDAVVSFADTVPRAIQRWERIVERYQDSRGGVAVWGGGSKAVAFMTSVSLSEATVVDINPHKQGKWLPTVGLQVHDPSVLEDIQPALVIPMNAIYQNEIEDQLAAMGLNPVVDPL